MIEIPWGTPDFRALHDGAKGPHILPTHGFCSLYSQKPLGISEEHRLLQIEKSLGSIRRLKL